MSQTTLPSMTEAEYLAWEDHQDRPHEFDGFRVIAMNGGTIDHEQIQGNLKLQLMLRLRGSSCRVFGPTMRVPTTLGRYRYPDAVVTCQRADGKARDLPAPVVIFEIASESTLNEDRGDKLVEYRSIPTLARYVMIEQTAQLVTVITRSGDIWSIDVLRTGETLTLPELNVEIPLAEIYEGVDLPEAP